MNSSDNAYEKLCLVPINTYEKIIEKCDGEEKDEISKLNPSESQVSLSMDSKVNDLNENKTHETTELTLNQIKDDSNVKPEIPSPIPSIHSSSNNDSKNVVPLKNDSSMTRENRDQNDCPPTSQNSILRIKPYLCQTCSKRYATPFTLKRHQKNKHGIGQIYKPQENLSNDVKEKQQSTQNLKKNFDSDNRYAVSNQVSRKRKLVDEDIHEENEEIPIKRVRRATGIKRKYNEKEYEQRKRKQMVNWNTF